jgi:CBS domain-containing protein
MREMTPEGQGPVGWYRKGSYFAELPPAFANARVEHVMRHGVLSCPPETSIRAVAEMMAANHVHALVVTGFGDGGPGREGWAVITDLALMQAARGELDAERTAGDLASRPVVVSATESVAHAAELMSSHATSHLVVVDEEARPSGVVSTLDLAAALAWGVG